MRNPVQHPMAENAGGNHERTDLVAAQGKIDRREGYGPDGVQQQAVRPGIAREVERRHLGNAWCDANALPAKNKEDRPQTVGKLGGEKERSERSSWRNAL